MRSEAIVVILAGVLALMAEVAHAQYLSSEPGRGELPSGKSVLVDDGSCGAGKVKMITGGGDNTPRQRKCVAKGARVPAASGQRSGSGRRVACLEQAGITEAESAGVRRSDPRNAIYHSCMGTPGR